MAVFVLNFVEFCLTFIKSSVRQILLTS